MRLGLIQTAARAEHSQVGLAMVQVMGHRQLGAEADTECRRRLGERRGMAAGWPEVGRGVCEPQSTPNAASQQPGGCVALRGASGQIVGKTDPLTDYVEAIDRVGYPFYYWQY